MFPVTRRFFSTRMSELRRSMPARSAVMSTSRRMSSKGRRRGKKPARKLQRMMRRRSRRKPSQSMIKRLKKHHPSTSRMALPSSNPMRHRRRRLKRRCRLTSQASLRLRQRRRARRNRSSRSPRWTTPHRRIWNCRMCLPACPATMPCS